MAQINLLKQKTASQNFWEFFPSLLVKILILDAPRWLRTGVYVVMGWLCMAAIGEMLHVLPTGALIWLIVGGVVYTLGAIIYATKILDFIPGKFGFHEVWHIFVLLAAIAHFIAVMGVAVTKGIS